LFLALNHVIGRGVHLEVPPLGLSFWRWLVAALLLLPFILSNSAHTFSVYRSHWRAFAVAGCMIAVASSLIMVALNFTTATNVAVINATQPTITVLLSRLLYAVPVSAARAFGVLVAFLGVLLMISRGDWQLLLALQFNKGDLIALLAMLGFAGYAIVYARIPHGLSAARGLFPVVAVSTAVLLPFYVTETLLYRPVPINAVSIGAILTIALLVSCAAMLLWNRGISLLGANRASIFINLVPVFGALFAVVFLGEQFQLYHLAGMLMIGLGVWFVAP
jgi:drug/metabolite transporter (DMT)-like permease